MDTNNTIKLEIADFLGYCDMNGEEALTSEQVEKLEQYIIACNEAMTNSDTPLVVDAIYDRLVEILKKVNPEAGVLTDLWSDDAVSEEEFRTKDTYYYLNKEPMRSICTCKSFDCQELKDFVKRLPDRDFEAHISCKENGHGIRMVFANGDLIDATSRGRSTAGRNLTSQLNLILGKTGLTHIEALEDIDMIEIRGEVVLPFANLAEARRYNPNIVSAFTGVSSMLRDSATEDETKLLDLVAYKVVSDDLSFETKSQEYEFLEDLGFTVPLYWVLTDLNKETLLSELPSIVSDCEEEVAPAPDGSSDGYEYFTDGLVFELNDRELFNSLGSDDKKYNYGNVALKVGYWKQDMYSGYVQTILWTDGKTKYSPVAIVAEDMGVIELEDETKNYISSLKEIQNPKDLGVVTASGNRVTRVPLYEPNNMLALDAFPGNVINFRYGGEAGVVPCFPDGTPLIEGKIKSMMESDNGIEYDDTGDYLEF